DRNPWLWQRTDSFQYVATSTEKGRGQAQELRGGCGSRCRNCSLSGAAYSAKVVSGIHAILLDAGGVLIFPAPDLVLPPLRAAGVSADAGALERAPSGGMWSRH